jgi:hypothetical protein
MPQQTLPASSVHRPAASDPAPGAESIRRARPIATRLVFCLALFGIVPGTALIVAEGLANLWPGDDTQLYFLLVTCLVVLASLAIWRSCVRWSLGRCAGTAIVTLVPVAQILWWQPMFNVGCGVDNVLRAGQSEALLGLWIWGTVWVWWGIDRGFAFYRRHRPVCLTRSNTMTPTARTIVMGYGLFPVVMGLYLVSMIFFDYVVDLEREFPQIYMLSNLVCGLVSVGIWIMAWRRRVIWKRRTRLLTILTSGALLVLGTACPMVVEDWSVDEAYCVALPLMFLGFWMIVTTWIWPAKPEAIQNPVRELVRCARCGYSLVGLYATRCPECGYEPTLEEFSVQMITEPGL